MTTIYIATKEDTYEIKEDVLTEREILKVTANLDEAVKALVDEQNRGKYLGKIHLRQAEYEGKKEYEIDIVGNVIILDCGKPLIALDNNLFIKRYEV